MSEHGLCFTADMIRAFLDGRKTQTRRPVTFANSSIPSGLSRKQWPELDFSGAESVLASRGNFGSYLHVPRPCQGTLIQVFPLIQPGDVIWARETWQDYCPLWQGAWCGHGFQADIERDHQPVYKADDPALWLRNGAPPKCWRPSIHMPRWASRIVRPVLSVRAERLWDMSNDDAIAEGVGNGAPCAWRRYRLLYDSIYGTAALNPWNWVYEVAKENAE